MTEERDIRFNNLQGLLAAVVWHLNNHDKDGNPTTNMGIPNIVYVKVEKIVAQLSSTEMMSEQELLALARRK